MSKNVNVNGVDYSGVSQVQLKTTEGGTALFKDVDEIVTPSGVKTITENGTYDVTNFATLVANIAAGGGLPLHTGEEVISNSNTQKFINHNLNLSAYVCIFWRADIAEFIADTSGSVSSIVCGISAYNFDFGLASEGKHTTTHVFSKGYNQSTSAWGTRNLCDENNAGASSNENKCYINTLDSARSGTYKWVIIDITSLNGGA